MRTFITTTLLFIFLSSLAQDAPPEFINYSSVIRGNTGQALPNKTISFRFTIRELSETGNISYRETQSTTTSQVGSVSIKIGSGQSQTGQFSDINWGIGSHYLQIELDDDGGSNFSNMGTVMLVSVPYSLYSKTASIADSAITYQEEDPVFQASVAGGITVTDTVNWNAALKNSTVSTYDPMYPQGMTKEYVSFILGPDISYTVPTGKNLYTIQGGGGLVVDGIKYFGQGFLFGSETELIWDEENDLNGPVYSAWIGFLVNEESYIEPVLFSLNDSNSYTVPSGKTLVLKTWNSTPYIDFDGNLGIIRRADNYMIFTENSLLRNPDLGSDLQGYSGYLISK